MHLFLCAEDSEAELRLEFAEFFPDTAVSEPQPSILEVDFEVIDGRPLPRLVFARQWLPHACPVAAETIRTWAQALFTAIIAELRDDQPWSLHIEPHYGARMVQRIGARAWHSASRVRSGARDVAKLSRGSDSGPPVPCFDPEAGRHRCRLIREELIELMQKKRRHLLRRLRTEPAHFTGNDTLVQLLLTAPGAGFISIAPAPMPFEQRHLLSPFPKGELPTASDQAAPSRAFAKLVEAELRLGLAISAGETCVDLGASPGSWTYTAVNRGARVVAIDRSPLREDLMRHRHVKFHAGDAFRFKPQQPFDWLLCDVIAPPERTAELLLEWLRRGWCRHFIVTLKLGEWHVAGKSPGSQFESAENPLASLRRALPLLTSELFMMRLCANKKEVCVFGSRRETG